MSESGVSLQFTDTWWNLVIFTCRLRRWIRAKTGSPVSEPYRLCAGLPVRPRPVTATLALRSGSRLPCHRSHMRHARIVRRLVEILGSLLVRSHFGVDVGVGPTDHAHVREGLTQLGPPQADITENGHDPHEQEVPELPQRLAVLDVHADLGRELEALPDLLTEEAVPHEVAGLNAEVLPLGALRLAQLR